MSADAQRALPLDDSFEDRKHAATLKERCRAVAEMRGFAELAAALDHAFNPEGRPVSTGMLHNTLADHERNYLRAEWLVRMVKCGDEGEAIVEFLANIIGRTLTMPTELTPQQRLEQLEEDVIHEFGAAGARLIGNRSSKRKGRR